jgi:hypothetical protein
MYQYEKYGNDNMVVVINVDYHIRVINFNLSNRLLAYYYFP